MGTKKHLVFDRTDGKSVLTVKTVTVGMSKSHGSTLFTLMPFNSIFATWRRTGSKSHRSCPAPWVAGFLKILPYVVSCFREIYGIAIGAGDGHKALLVITECAFC